MFLSYNLVLFWYVSILITQARLNVEPTKVNSTMHKNKNKHVKKYLLLKYVISYNCWNDVISY